MALYQYQQTGLIFQDSEGSVDVVLAQAAKRRKRSTTVVAQFTYSSALTPTVNSLVKSSQAASVLGKGPGMFETKHFRHIFLVLYS